MFKRLLIGLIIAIVLAGVFLIFLFGGKDSLHTIDPSEAVPSNAIIYLDNIDYEYLRDDFFATNLLWQELLNYSYFNGLESSSVIIGEIFERLSVIQDGIGKDALSISLHMTGYKTVYPLFLQQLKGNIASNVIEEEMRTLFGIENKITQRKYEGVTIYDIALGENNKVRNLSYAVKNGIFMLSPASILLEEAIRCIDSGGGIAYRKGFSDVAATAGKYVQGNLYVNYVLLKHLFSPLFKAESGIRSSMFSSMASWGEFDVDIDDNLVLLNGMTYSQDSAANLLNLFKDQEPVRFEATSYVPSGVSQFMAVGISDKNEFLKRLKDHLKYKAEYQLFSRMDDNLIAILGESPMNTLLELMEDEIVWFKIDPLNNGIPEEVVIYELKSSSKATDRMENWIGSFAATNQNEVSQSVDIYNLDEQTSYKIYETGQKFYDRMFLEKFVKSNFSFYDNYLIFSDSKEAIKRTIHQNVLHKTLINETYFEPVSNLMSSRMNLTFFIRPESYVALNENNFNKEILNNFREWSPTLQKTAGIVVQYSNENEIFYSSVSADFSSGVKENALTVWESLLDSVVITKPSLVVNHYTGDREILVQDAGNTLYLINSTGRILWKFKLEGPVKSDFFQVDYYNNGKLQYLFNTAGAAHLIDRNGNYVERYPIKFRSNATNGIALFDYEKNKNYRVFVACEDRSVYCYDIEGNLITGWGFDKTEGKVVNPLQHFRIKDKDYIVFDDENRIYILNRRGGERVNMKGPVSTSVNNQFYFRMDLVNDSPQLVTTDTDGNVIGINFNGESRVILENEAGEDHLFVSADLDQDGNPEYIFGDENELKVLDYKGKRLFSFKIKSDISTLPDLYQFSSSDMKIGITDKKNNSIYLMNSDGTLYEGFPLKGNSRFSIGYFAGSDSRFNLIVGSRNSFLYNYSIE